MREDVKALLHCQSSNEIMKCGGQSMGSCPPPSSCNVSYSKADLNSNISFSKESKETSSIRNSLLDSTECNFYSSTRDLLEKNSFPSSIFAPSLGQKDISYDDLSKNIDANLAEIDMETFRTEDIHSILTLPTIFSGNYQNDPLGQQYTSVSGSLLGGFELEYSISPRTSEDEISICKDEPLFSPLREPSALKGTISVDSLDSGSLEEHDLVLTCQVIKNNYTIAFEGSGTQFSDDSEYQDLSSKDDANNLNKKIAESFAHNSMVQSDMVFTTWNNLKRTSKRLENEECRGASKSHSLPNLNNHSIFVSDKKISPRIKDPVKKACLPLYDVQSSQMLCSKENNGNENSSVSLFKLFIKHKISNSPEWASMSSSQSDDSNSFGVHSFSHRISSLQNSLETKRQSQNTEDIKSKTDFKQDLKNDNETEKTLYLNNNCTFTEQICKQLNEANNNTINSLQITDNNNVAEVEISKSQNEEDACGGPDSEEDNSQYFEDSLVEVPLRQQKIFDTTPIEEEEEPSSMSTVDEIMRESRNSFESLSSSCGENIEKNATEDQPIRQQWGSRSDRISNVLAGKSNSMLVNNACTFIDEDKIPSKQIDLCSKNQSESTQTKVNNGLEVDKQIRSCSENLLDNDVLNSSLLYSPCKDSSPLSSGYLSSRQNSVERMKQNPQSFVKSRTANQHRKHKTILTTTYTQGTQIPLHVQDVAIQASLCDDSFKFVFTNQNHNIEKEIAEILEISEKVENDSSDLKTSRKIENPTIEKKSVYVCYPNYSLPDLSFLKNISGSFNAAEVIYLSPTKYKLPENFSLHETNVKSKAHTAIENLSEEQLTNIKDWDSLNILLPEELKTVISHRKDRIVETTNQNKSVQSKNGVLCSCFNIDNCTSSSCICHLMTNASSILKHEHSKPRSILRKSSSASHCGCDAVQVDPISCSLRLSDPNATAQVRQMPLVEPNHRLFLNPERNAQFCKADQSYLDASCPQRSSLSRVDMAPNCTDKCHAVCSILSKNADLNKCKETINEEKAFNNIFIDKSFEDHTFLKHLKNSDLLSQDSRSADVKTSWGNCNNVMCSKGKKIVSFCENIEVREQKHSTCFGNHQCSPLCVLDCSNHSESREDDFEDNASAPQEFLVSPLQGLSPMSPTAMALPFFPSTGISPQMFQEILKKKTGLVDGLQKAVDHLVEHFKIIAANEQVHDGSFMFFMGKKVLGVLCPAILALLSDGLLPNVQGFFGSLPNTPWRVAESSVQRGDGKKEIEELIADINAKKVFNDDICKFNALIIGLLNLHCLDWWVNHLCVCQNLICHHYHPTALLSLLTLPAATYLREELRGFVKPLCSLPFSLDLMLEVNYKRFLNKTTISCNSDNMIPQSIMSNRIVKNLAFLPETENLCSEQQNVIDDTHQLPLWPGITIYPFSNCKSPEERCESKVPKLNSFKSNCLKSRLQNAQMMHCGSHQDVNANDDKVRLTVPEPSICSSTDSGCSSQAEHLQLIPQGTEKSKNKKQFQKLRQKFENASKPNEQSDKNYLNLGHHPPVASQTKNKELTKTMGKSLNPPVNRTVQFRARKPNRNIGTNFSRVASHSPTTRKSPNPTNSENTVSNKESTRINNRFGSPVDWKVSETKRSKVPTPAAPAVIKKSAPPKKSLIPVHKLGLRTRSASRESNCIVK